MRVIGIVAAMLLASASPAVAGDLAPFEFKQMNADLTLQAALDARLVERCAPASVRGLPVTTCATSERVWRGGVAGYEMYGSFASFDETGLVSYDVAILQSGLLPVEAAFKVKYGEPCDVQNTTLQNGFGATFEQVTDVWCFSDGQLKLSRYAARNMKRSGIVFTSSRFTERKAVAPPVNF